MSNPGGKGSNRRNENSQAVLKNWDKVQWKTDKPSFKVTINGKVQSKMDGKTSES